MQSGHSRMGSERGEQAADAAARVVLPCRGCEMVRSWWVTDRCDFKESLCIRNAI